MTALRIMVRTILPYMRCIPNMIVSAPMNEAELRNLMYTAQLDENTISFRYAIRADKV